MRLTIRKSPSGRQFTFPIPYRIAINLIFRETWFKWISKGTDSPHKATMDACLDALDFAELRYIFKQLDDYENLIIMEVEAEDGTYFRLTT